MRSLSKSNTSFVVRIWWEEGEAEPDRQRFWRGWVQHVRSGEAAYVEDVERLLDFIERWTGSLRGPQASAEKPSKD